MRLFFLMVFCLITSLFSIQLSLETLINQENSEWMGAWHIVQTAEILGKGLQISILGTYTIYGHGYICVLSAVWAA